jgi:hypothetical protein
MSPLDDELRSLLHARADVLSPAPDPLAGIEQRAKRIRRTRVAAAVAGSALVVAAIGVAVPSLIPARGGGAGVATTTEPTPSASATAAAPPGALDPQHPWEYRGNKKVIAANELASLQSEWQTKHPGATVKPLYGSIYESSRRPEIAFVSTGGGQDRWGVATSSEAGWTWLHDEVLAPATTALLAALPGDEVGRLLVIAAPTTGQIEYAKDGSSFRPLTGVAPDIPGVAYAPLEGDTSHDLVRVLDGNGDMDHPVFLGPAPDYVRPTPTATPPSTAQPQETTSAPTLAAKYAFDPVKPWAYRGTNKDGYGDIVSADRKQFATDHGEQPGQDTPLYVVHLSATTDVAVVLHARPDGDWVSFTAHQGTTTHQLAYRPAAGEDILSTYLPLDSSHGLLIGVASDQAANLVLQTGSRAEVGGSRTAGIWDWTTTADPMARLAAYAAGDIEPYSSQPAT